MKIRINIFQSEQFNKITKFLFLLTLFLLPYDAIKIMPSVYKPICLIPALLLFLFLLPKIIKDELSKQAIALTVFVAITIFNTVVANIFLVGTFANFFDFIVTLGLLYTSFLGLSYVFKDIVTHYGTKDSTLYFFRIIALAYIFPLFVAIIDALSVYHILPSSIKSIIMIVFGGNQVDRVTGTSFESSWLTFHLMVSVVAFMYMFIYGKKVKYVVFALLAAACFVITFSMQGILILAIFGLVYLIRNLRKAKVSTIFIGAVVAFFAVTLFVVVLNSYEGDTYFIRRIKNFTNFSDMFKNDLSAFVRIGYPIIGLRMFADNPIFGVGGANYGIYLGEYIDRYYPWALTFYGTTQNEVYSTVMAQSGNAKNLYSRLLCEFGIIPSIVFGFFIYYGVRSKEESKMSLMLVILVLCFFIQFDSLCFALFIIPFAFYSSLPIKKEMCTEDNKLLEFDRGV